VEVEVQCNLEDNRAKMIFLKTQVEIELIRKSSLLVSKTLAEIAKAIRPGVTTLSLDKLAEEFIRDNGAVPSFKGYRAFPYTLCISVNEQVVHGMPSDRELKEEDLVSVDCGVFMNGFHGDSAYTFYLGDSDSAKLRLMRVTKECLDLGIEKAVIGNRVGDIGDAIQRHAESNGYSVVRDLVGHGIGKALHEDPEVPNYGKRGSGVLFKEGLTIAVEPMINIGTRHVKTENDGWTLSTVDKKPSAHFEHTISIGKGKAEILTSFEYIEEVLNNHLVY
jgi:methionyl aminopeptidase